MSTLRSRVPFLLIAFLVVLLSACGDSAATSIPATGTSATAAKKLSGELTVYLDEYYNPTNDKETATLAETIAKEYETAHPGVKINLVPSFSNTERDNWLDVRMAANQAPDIMWQQFTTRNLRGSSWWVPLNQYLDKPNPYIAAGTPGHDKWSDSLTDYVLAQTRGTDGNWYQVSLDWVETGLYYNKDLFTKAGVDPTTWKNWASFVSDMKKVKTTTGVDPLGMFLAQQGWSTWYWMDDMLLTANWADKASDFYMDKYNIPGLKARQLTPEEVAKAVLTGKLSATDARMDNYLTMSKDYIGLLPSNYASIASIDAIDPLFYQGKVAATWTGTWKNKPFAKNIPFNYGIAYLPPFTADDAKGATGTTYRVGGPSAAGQYGIAQSAVKNGKLDLAVDFLQYLSAPQNFGRLAKTLGGYLPKVKGAETGQIMQGFNKIADLPERLFTDPDGRLVPEAGDPWSQAMTAYLTGQTDAGTTKQTLQKIWQDGAKSLCTAKKYDWCPKT